MGLSQGMDNGMPVFMAEEPAVDKYDGNCLTIGSQGIVMGNTKKDSL